MATKRESINILGINTATADNVLKDGACEDILNLRFKNGQVEQIYDFETINAVDETYSTISASNIILKASFLSDNHYLYFGENTTTNPSFIGECVATQDANSHDILSHVKTVFTFPTTAYPTSIDQISINQFGNIIYINYGQKEWSLLYKLGEYHTVDLSSLPEITFDVETEYHSLTEDVGSRSISSITDNDAKDFYRHMTEVLAVKHPDGLSEYSQNAEITDSYLIHIGTLNNLGYIVGEFKLALAYILYDGTIIKASEPKILTSFTKKNIVIGYDSESSDQEKEAGYTLTRVYRSTTSDCFFDYLTGIRVKITNILQSSINAIDGDVVKGMMILATRPVNPYNYHNLYYEWIKGSPSSHTLTGSYRREWGIPRTIILDKEQYRKATDIWYELKEIDFNTDYTSNFINIENDTIKDVEHNPVVSANYSHHTLTSEKKFDFNSRLHRYITKNVLFNGYDYSIGSISGTTDIIKRAKEYLRVTYGSTQSYSTATVSFVTPSSTANKFQFSSYTDRHGEVITGYFPAFQFTSDRAVTAEEGVCIEIEYTFTRNGSSGAVTVYFENVSLSSGSNNWFVDNSATRIVGQSEITAETVNTSVSSGYPIIISAAHTGKYINIYTRNMFAIVTLKINNEYVKVRKDFTGWYFTSGSTTYHAIKNYVVYPDARAESIRFGYSVTSNNTTTNYLSINYKLTADEGNNIAFSFLNPTPVAIANTSNWDTADNSGTLAPAFAMILTSSSDSIATSTTVIENNKLYVSEENNPFYYAPKNVYSIGTINTKILEIQPAIEHLSETKFGYYPLYMFANDGIYAMDQGNDILYQSIQKISGDVKLTGTNTTVIGTSVMFISEKGIMELQQRKTQCISSVLDKYVPLVKYATLADFQTYMQNAQLLYNQGERELIVFNKTYTYAYVFNITSQQWTRRTFAGRLIDDMRTLVGDGVRDMWRENKNSPISSGLIYTRALKLGSLEFKRIERAILRETHDSNTTYTIILQGSNNLKSWSNLRTLTTQNLYYHQPASWKYYRFIITFTMGTTAAALGTNFATTSIDVEYYLKFVHRLK